jgi:hypothetical protein
MGYDRPPSEGSKNSALAFGPKDLFVAIALSRFLVLAGLSLAPSSLHATVPGILEDEATSALSRSFRCPEDYPSDEAKRAAVKGFMQAYAATFPNNNVRDMLLFRYRLLVAHSCVQTLKSMLADVSPLSEMLSMEKRDYGPRTEEFDPETKVWTVHFRRDGDPPAFAEEELIFNFYGWKPATSPEAIAQRFINRRDNLRILGKYAAPDDVTKATAYFIVSETLYPGEPDGYVNISKISSVGTGAYTVTFSKKISGTNVEEKGKAWFLSEEGQTISRAIDHVGVDPLWEEHFSHSQK